MKRSNPIENAFKAALDRVAELEAEVVRLEWQVEEWRKANLPIVSKCAELQRQLAQAQAKTGTSPRTLNRGKPPSPKNQPSINFISGFLAKLKIILAFPT